MTRENGLGDVFWTGTEARPTSTEARSPSPVGHGGPTDGAGGQTDLPTRTDCVVVGAGYTGLSAARTLARRGCQVLVLEKETAGFGASTRNGGFVLPGYKRELPSLIKALGFPRALEVFEESLRAMAFLEALIADDRIDCEYRRAGHLSVAESSRQLDDLESLCDLLERRCRYRTTLLGADRIGDEVGSPRYVGGLLDPRGGSLHPARLFAGLLRSALAAGATLAEGAAVESIERNGGRFVIRSNRGTVTADDVLIATNGYRPPHAGLRRRIIPIGSHIIATAPLDRHLQRTLLPHARLLSDSRHLLHYYRMSSDGRLLFGGRAAFAPITTPAAAARLRRHMIEIFPVLAGTAIDFAWSGTLGFTRDQLPHAGRMDGVAYASGYCGHGVAMSLYLGHRMGEHMAGADPPPLAGLDFPAIPLYNGRPWFLPLAGAWFRLRDILDR